MIISRRHAIIFIFILISISKLQSQTIKDSLTLIFHNKTITKDLFYPKINMGFQEIINYETKNDSLIYNIYIPTPDTLYYKGVSFLVKMKKMKNGEKCLYKIYFNEPIQENLIYIKLIIQEKEMQTFYFFKRKKLNKRKFYLVGGNWDENVSD
ncbi:MAG: hypothetical protein H6Q15_1277 [Bacteroidetes bacterium]|nr:hypothetical protein [Bacteroidota bacterium]